MKELFLIIFVALTGCAASPENIAPLYQSEIPYQTWSCEQLAFESKNLSDALAAASTAQQNARSNDTIGIIFLGLPVSTLSGNNMAGEIARLKGEQEVIKRETIVKNCVKPLTG